MFITHHDALNTLLGSCSQPFVAAKITGEIILVNQALCELTGYTKEELLQMTWTELTPAEWWNSQTVCIQELLSSLQPVKYKKEYIHKDGHRIPVELQLDAMTDTEGNLKYLYTFITDMTDRIEQERKFAEDSFRKMFHASLNPTLLTSLDDGRYIEVNAAYLKLIGYEREEVIGRTSHDTDTWTSDETRPMLVEMIKKDGKVSNCEVSIRTKSGEIAYILASINLLDIDGKKYALSSLNDITERKKLEERFEKAFHSNSNAMAIVAWPEGKLVDVNQAWLNLFGFQKEQVIGLTTTDLGFWDDINEKHQLYQTIREKKKLRDYELTCRACDGSARTILISADFIEIDGKEHLIISMTDITYYKRLEREIARLDSLNLIGELSAGVAHEIRNPLTVVKGYLQYFGGKSSEYKEQFEALSNEIAHVETIITDFLSLARNKTTVLSNRSLNSIIEEVSPFIMADALKKGVDIELNLGTISCFPLDDKELKQLILNLVRNAVEAVDGKGKVTIETRMEDGNVLISVSDTGCGIPKELCDRIFDPFFTTKEKGTGLGLSICASIVERHGGTIQVKSNEGQGTNFLVRFALM